MSNKHIYRLLQECLSAYEQGLSPDKCLAAFPENRDELEPLLRQALSLRVAFAAAPAQAFKAEAREKLMFAAGRDVVQAFSSEPDPQYVARTRERFLEAAGASAQEALRAVPPPRLPFWVNTRRRLLEAAARPAAPPAQRGFGTGLRLGLSGAVVALAIAVAGIGIITTQSSPRSVNAELASLEQDLQAVEAQARSGQIVPASVIIELSRRTTELVEKLNEQPAQVSSAEKLPAIIERQQVVASQAVIEGPPPELRQAQQNLAQAEEKALRIFASAAATPTPPPQVAAAPATSAPAPTATTGAATVAPTSPPATATAATTVPANPAALQPGQVAISLRPSDNFANLSWTEVRTTTIHFVMPSDWTVAGLTIASNGTASLNGSQHIRVQNPSASIVAVVNVKTGETSAIVDGQVITLRGEGFHGALISPSDLVGKAGADAGIPLYHLADSIEVPEPEPTPTPTQTAVPPTATQAPPTATPPPAQPAP